jgi:predicted glycosyltransferase
MIKYIKKNHNVLCTSRDYNQVTDLAKIRGQKLIIIGKHGGAKRYSKLDSSLQRAKILSKRIKIFSPDIVVSFCSPEAARVSYGLGIQHVCFSDSPHAKAVMRLVIPLVQKLLIPWIIPKKEFTKFGINAKDIIHYKAIDAAVITKRKILKNNNMPSKKEKRKTILIRVEEEEASYSSKKRPAVPIIKEIIRNFHNEKIVIMARYDGKTLLNSANVFIGSGGTMTAESALLGIPTISYNAVPNIIESYLVRKKLVVRKSNPRQIAISVRKLLDSSNLEIKKRAKKMLDSMEDPYPILVKTIKSILK